MSVKNKRLYVFLLVLTVIIVCGSVPYSSFFARANAMAPYTEGITETGVVVLGSSPVEVKKEDLTFYVPTLSKAFSENNNCYLTAEYTFYNPTVTDYFSRVVFPVGMVEYGPEQEKYGVEVDGTKCPVTYRCTYGAYSENFDYKKESSNLSDRILSDPFFTADLPVFKYKCTVNTAEEECFVCTAFSHSQTNEERKISLDALWYSYSEDKTELGLWMNKTDDRGNEIWLYSFGKAIDADIVFDLYTTGSKETRVDGNVEVSLHKQYSFRDYVLEQFDNEKYSETDRYNAVIACLQAESAYQSVDRGIYPYDIVRSAQQQLLVWYQYEMNFPAKSEVTNKVTAPLYPGTYNWYSPYIYQYTYVWSPAKSWASFSSLTVKIVTPYYLIDQYTPYPFERTEEGYVLYLDSLPKQGELVFALCEEANPRERSYFGGEGALGSIGLFILIGVGILVGIFIVIILFIGLILVIRERRK